MSRLRPWQVKIHRAKKPVMEIVMQCPKCKSDRIEKRNIAKRVGTAIGLAAGAAGGSATIGVRSRMIASTRDVLHYSWVVKRDAS